MPGRVFTRKHAYKHLVGAGDQLDISSDSLDENTIDIDATTELLQGMGTDVTATTFTVEEAIDSIGWGRFQYVICAVSGLGMGSEAMEMMILAILSPALHCEWGVSSTQQAFVTTSVFVGMMLGAVSWGVMCDTYGRKAGVLLSFFLTFHVGFLSAFSPSIGWVYFLRGLIGFTITGGAQTSTMLIEFTPTSARMYMQFMGIFWAIGNVLVILIAIVVMPTLGWRWQLAICASPVLIASFIIWTSLPESIRYQVTHGYHGDALKTIQKMARLNKKTMPKGELKVQSDSEKKETNWKDLFNIRLRRTTFTLWYIWFTAAFSYYGVSLLNTELMKTENGCPSSSKNLTSNCILDCSNLTSTDYAMLLITSISEFLSVPLSVVLVRYVKRRKAMGFLYLGFSFFTCILMACVSKTLVSVTMLGVRTCCSTVFGLIYLYTLEVYPTSLRGSALGVCSSTARIGGIITPFIAQVLLQSSFHATVVTYAIVGFLAGVACFLLPIETKDVDIADY